MAISVILASFFTLGVYAARITKKNRVHDSQAVAHGSDFVPTYGQLLPGPRSAAIQGAPRVVYWDASERDEDAPPMSSQRASGRAAPLMSMQDSGYLPNSPSAQVKSALDRWLFPLADKEKDEKEEDGEFDGPIAASLPDRRSVLMAGLAALASTPRLAEATAAASDGKTEPDVFDEVEKLLKKGAWLYEKDKDPPAYMGRYMAAPSGGADESKAGPVRPAGPIGPAVTAGQSGGRTEKPVVRVPPTVQAASSEAGDGQNAGKTLLDKAAFFDAKAAALDIEAAALDVIAAQLKLKIVTMGGNDAAEYQAALNRYQSALDAQRNARRAVSTSDQMLDILLHGT